METFGLIALHLSLEIAEHKFQSGTINKNNFLNTCTNEKYFKSEIQSEEEFLTVDNALSSKIL